jgi:hypothetical protein
MNIHVGSVGRNEGCNKDFESAFSNVFAWPKTKRWPDQSMSAAATLRAAERPKAGGNDLPQLRVKFAYRFSAPQGANCT